MFRVGVDMRTHEQTKVNDSSGRRATHPTAAKSASRYEIARCGVHTLQRQMGNRGASAYLTRQTNMLRLSPAIGSQSSMVIQARLTVNAPNDPYEREAE